MIKLGNAPVTFDTNILIYSIDPRDGLKHLASKQILRTLVRADSSVPLQCLNEFYFAATRKRLVEASEAARVVATLRRAMRVIPPTESDLVEAMAAH